MRWLVVALSVIDVAAQESPTNPEKGAEQQKPPIVSKGNGLYQVGDILLDKNTSTVSFPGFVNMTNLVVEYAIVGSTGKRHESVLATKVPPFHIHMSALLLGATNKISHTVSGQPLSGNPIDIWISWKSGEIEMKLPMENLVRKGSNGSPMSRGTWLYNGSRVIAGTFVAQRDESIVSIMEDPDALVNNPRAGRENDDIWFVHNEAIPPIDTPVQITFDFSPSR